MNNKENVVKGIIDFFNSDEDLLLLNGTNQSKKHPIALAIAIELAPPNSSILFRVNGSNNFKTFLEQVFKLSKKPRSGVPINLKDGKKLYLDTINRASWSKTPNNLQYVILYPVDSLNSKSGEENLRDIKYRNPKKILFVSWTDNKDMSWIYNYSPKVVTYDAFEEDPEYHKRIKDICKDFYQETIKGLPNYAKNQDSKYLIKILCRGNCGKSRWALLNKPYPGEEKLRKAKMGEYSAKCLVCGYNASDNYNWMRE